MAIFIHQDRDGRQLGGYQVGFITGIIGVGQDVLPVADQYCARRPPAVPAADNTDLVAQVKQVLGDKDDGGCFSRAPIDRLPIDTTGTDTRRVMKKPML